MKNKIANLIKHPLFSGSALMILGSNLANFIAYLYHLIIGRMLGPVAYGELSSVISALALIFISLNFLSLIIVKFVSSAQKNSIYTFFTRQAFRVGVVLALIVLVLSPFFSNFLHISLATFLLIVPILTFAVPTFVYRSFLQGLLRFKEVVVSTNIDIVGRLVLGVIFVIFGFSSFGAVMGICLSSILTFFFLRFLLKDYRLSRSKSPFSKIGNLISYAKPLFFATLATNSMFSTDVILVKHYFNAHEAGIYASISTLGRIIFYGAGPVGAVMFPMIAQKYSRGENYKKIFSLSALFTGGIILAVLFVYLFFPALSIRILFGEKFLEGSSLLFPFGIFMALFTFASLLVSYFLAKDKTKVTFITVLSAILQVAGITFFHTSLQSVIKVSIFASAFLLVLLVLYLIYEVKKDREHK